MGNNLLHFKYICKKPTLVYLCMNTHRVKYGLLNIKTGTKTNRAKLNEQKTS